MNGKGTRQVKLTHRRELGASLSLENHVQLAGCPAEAPPTAATSSGPRPPTPEGTPVASASGVLLHLCTAQM